MIGHGPNEFLIDFIFAAPGMPRAPVVSRVMMTPENAKQLLFALTDNIKRSMRLSSEKSCHAM